MSAARRGEPRKHCGIAVLRRGFERSAKVIELGANGARVERGVYTSSACASRMSTNHRA